MTPLITPKDREKVYQRKRHLYKKIPKHPAGMYQMKLRLERYDKMLEKYATVPGHISFYCRPADEKDIPTWHREYLDEEEYEYVYNCPRCSAIMEKYFIERGCGHITAYYCKNDILHWVYDCHGLIPPRKWYGPFPDNPKDVVSQFYGYERSAEFALHLKSWGKEKKIVTLIKSIKNRVIKK